MKTLQIVKTDFKNITRDPSMLAILFAPLLIVFILRFLPPIYEAYFPVMVAYRPLILSVFALTISALSGFLVAFVMLDEKDQQLFEVFRIMQFTFPKLVRFRILIMFIIGLLFCILLIGASMMIELSVMQAIVLAFMCSLSGPANTLIIVSLASNKIEGATYFKALNIVIMTPLAALFIPGAWSYMAGVIPFYWVFKSAMLYQENGAFYLHAAIGIIMNALYLYMSYQLFIRRNK